MRVQEEGVETRDEDQKHITHYSCTYCTPVMHISVSRASILHKVAFPLTLASHHSALSHNQAFRRLPHLRYSSSDPHPSSIRHRREPVHTLPSSIPL